MTKRINHGKRFEADFKSSAEKEMFLYRLRDPGSSFNLKCQGCPKQVTRFSIKNICDFIGYDYPNQYLLELKSTKQKSIPFENIVKNEKDKRLQQMVDAQNGNEGIYSDVIFNFRIEGNPTYSVMCERVLHYINESERKSIPLSWVKENGIKIESSLKKVRYNYDIRKFLCDIKPF